MAKLIIEGLSKEAAEELGVWYVESGEQSADDWFDIRGVEGNVISKSSTIEENGDFRIEV